MRPGILHGAAAVAFAASVAQSAVLDSMCVVKDDTSGTLLEARCDVQSLHKKDSGRVGTEGDTEAGMDAGKGIDDPKLEDRVNDRATTVEVIVTMTEEPISTVPTAADKRATWISPSNTWLHTMLLSSTHVPVWVPYPVFTSDGTVWSATETKFDGTSATYVGGPIATAYAKRAEDGVGHDEPTFVQDLSTVVTITFAAETYEMAVSDDHVETFTVPPSTVTLSVPAQTVTAFGAAKQKRGEAEVPGVVATTTSFVFDPADVTTQTKVASLVSQSVVTATEVVTQTTTASLGSTTTHDTTTSTVAAAVNSSTAMLTEAHTSISDHSNHTTSFVTAEATTSTVTMEEVTSYVTAGAENATAGGSASTSYAVVNSTVTLPDGASTPSPTGVNGTSLSTFISYNVSTFTATGLTLNYDTSTLASISASTSSDATTTMPAVLSGSIGGGIPASTTKNISGASKAKNSPGLMPVFTAVLVGLAVVWYAERYLGRLHV